MLPVCLQEVAIFFPFPFFSYLLLFNSLIHFCQVFYQCFEYHFRIKFLDLILLLPDSSRAHHIILQSPIRAELTSLPRNVSYSYTLKPPALDNISRCQDVLPFWAWIEEKRNHESYRYGKGFLLSFQTSHVCPLLM